MSSEAPSNANFPASMGPGGKLMQPSQTSGNTLQELIEMRRQYTVEVEPSTLKVAYILNGERRSYNINWDAAPLSGFHKWICYGGRGRSMTSGMFLLDMLRGAENMTGRPLSQTEAEAFARYSAKRMTYGYLGTVAALGSGYLMAWRGVKIMKFPFKKPKPLENYDAFPLRRMPLLTGTYARSAWQVTRANIYAALGLIFLSPLFRGMGESVMAVGLYNDHRTRETVKAMKGGFDRIRMNRSRSSPRASPSAQVSSPSDDTDPNTFYDRKEDQLQSFYNKSADYAGDSTFSDGATDTGVQLDPTMRQKETRQPSSTFYGTSRPPAAPAQTSESSSSSSDFFFDDASPVAGSQSENAAMKAQDQAGGGSSTWARIRRAGRSQPTPTQTNSSSSGSFSNQQGGWRSPGSPIGQADTETKGDSFSFSSSDSDRALAKEQAQKEFDAMLDKERKESGSNEYDRGSYATEVGNENPQNSSTGSAWDRRRRGN